MPAPTIPTNVSELIADQMKRLIRADIDAGRLLAAEVRTFSDLHDHTDANVTYLGAARVACGLPEYDSSEQAVTADNAAMDIVNAWLGSHRRKF